MNTSIPAFRVSAQRIQRTVSIVDRIRETVQQVFIGKEKIVDLLLVGFFSGLHVLIEDVPGVGKTTMAKSLAASVNLDFARIQFTPDLLPGDITGVTVWDQTKKAFVYKEGAIMHQFILADEINRASPRTQSSLLEAMQEETDRESKSSAHRNPVTGAGVTPDGSPATVTGHSSHAWAEVWIEGAGWVQWEATHALDRRSYADVEDGLMYEFGMELDRETSRQIEAVLGSEVRDRPPETAGMDREDIDGFTLGALQFLLGMIVVIGLLWAVHRLHLLRMRSLGVMTHGMGREIRFRCRTRGLVRHLCRLGIPPPTEYGWENWARAVQLHYPNYSEAVKEYCDILCAYVYGGQALDPSWIDSWNRLQNITVSQEHS